jgi:hypothetical protein
VPSSIASAIAMSAPKEAQALHRTCTGTFVPVTGGLLYTRSKSAAQLKNTTHFRLDYYRTARSLLLFLFVVDEIQEAAVCFAFQVTEKTEP